ncbi:unnamed protein product [Boreogadus saida]
MFPPAGRRKGFGFMGFISVNDHGSTVTVNKDGTIIHGLPHGEKKRFQPPLQHEPQGALLNPEVTDIGSPLGLGLTDELTASCGVMRGSVGEAEEHGGTVAF